MSRFSGPQQAGAGRRRREQLRTEAAERAATPLADQVAALPEETRQAILASRTGLAKTARELGVPQSVVEAIWAGAEAA